MQEQSTLPDNVLTGTAPGTTRRIGLLAIALVGLALVLVFGVAPRAQESAGGEAQRIFYFHVSSAWLGFGAMALCAFGGWRYLRTRNLGWDRFALANAEITVLFLALMLLSGMLWGRPSGRPCVRPSSRRARRHGRPSSRGIGHDVRRWEWWVRRRVPAG